MSKKNKNNTKSKLIPELRFPEFKDKPQWEVKELGEVVATKRGLAGKNANDFGSGSPFVTYKQVFDFSAIELSKCGKVRIDEGENQNELHKGDVLITISSETAKEAGFASVVLDEPKEPTYLNSFCLALRPHSLEELHPNFARYVFQCSSFRDKATRIAQGITRYNITQADLLQLPLPLPSLAEQERIGALFSTLDSLIQAQSKEVQLLRLRKKGLMQKMFPYEGETTPEWRFPEFKDAPEWEVKELGEVFSFLTTNSLSRACLNYETGSIKNIHYGDIHTKFRSLFNINIEEVPYINDDITINNPNFCQVGDIIFADASEDLIDVGKTIEITDTNNELLVSGLHTIMARPSKGTFSKGFAAFLFQSNRIKQAIKFTAQGTKVYGITANSIKSIPLPLPSLAEQERIGALFSTLDSLIEAKSQRLEQLKNHKKGLMQQLFP